LLLCKSINQNKKIMKALYFILLAAVVVSCQNQGKWKWKTKLATVDSMKVEMEKQRLLIPCK
jgi:hypothetical protein